MLKRSVLLFVICCLAGGMLASCVSEGGGYASPSVHVGVGMHRGYYGHRPWGPYGRPPIIVAPGPGIDIDEPVAMPLPEPGPDIDMGFPDAGFLDF
jgi:hypothetical protein